jgi:hypothetical protein
MCAIVRRAFIDLFATLHKEQDKHKGTATLTI